MEAFLKNSELSKQLDLTGTGHDLFARGVSFKDKNIKSKTDYDSAIIYFLHAART